MQTLPSDAARVLGEGASSVRSFLRGAPSPVALARSLRAGYERAHCILPSTVEPGERVEATVQAWDRYERLVRGFEGSFAVESTDPAAELPDRVSVDGDGGGLARTAVTFRTPGIQYVTLTDDAGETWVSNPVEVVESPAERLYWADLHLHSLLSDGVGSVEKGLRFGRDVMALDVVAYTDHDTMGFFIPPEWQRRRMHRRGFDRTKEAVEAATEPGEFVALFGYEWTRQPTHGGHLNVYFDGVADAELFDSRSPESDSYEALWARLREWRERTGGDVLTIPHHPAEAMYPFDFSAVDYDDELAPLVEVYSQWGSSELPGDEGNPKPIGGIATGEVDEPGHHVRDALAMGHRVGLLAASDYHGPRPGHSLIHVPSHLPRLDELRDGLGWGTIWRLWNERSYAGGLTGLYAPELTREAVFDALRGRRVYATTQPDRILVRFRVGDVRLRDADPVHRLAAPDDAREVAATVAGTAPLERVTVVKNGEPWRTFAPAAGDGLGERVVEARFVDDAPVEGARWDDERGTDEDHYYLRVEQADGGMAWAGPVWVGAD